MKLKNILFLLFFVGATTQMYSMQYVYNRIAKCYENPNSVSKYRTDLHKDVADFEKLNKQDSCLFYRKSLNRAYWAADRFEELHKILPFSAAVAQLENEDCNAKYNEYRRCQQKILHDSIDFLSEKESNK